MGIPVNNMIEYNEEVLCSNIHRAVLARSACCGHQGWRRHSTVKPV